MCAITSILGVFSFSSTCVFVCALILWRRVGVFYFECLGRVAILLLSLFDLALERGGQVRILGNFLVSERCCTDRLMICIFGLVRLY